MDALAGKIVENQPDLWQMFLSTDEGMLVESQTICVQIRMDSMKCCAFQQQLWNTQLEVKSVSSPTMTKIKIIVICPKVSVRIRK